MTALLTKENVWVALAEMKAKIMSNGKIYMISWELDNKVKNSCLICGCRSLNCYNNLLYLVNSNIFNFENDFSSADTAMNKAQAISSDFSNFNKSQRQLTSI